MSLASRVALLGILVGSIAACSSAQEDAADDSSAAQTGASRFSYVGAAVHDALTQKVPAEKGSSWGESFDNKLDGNWIVQVPLARYWGATEVPQAASCSDGDSDCNADLGLYECASDADCSAHGGTCTALASAMKHETDTPKNVCAGHSDVVLDDVYNAILAGKRSVDITSLSPPDGRFEGAVRNAITRLADRSDPPQVRMLFGLPINLTPVWTLRDRYTRDVKPGSTLKLAVALQQQDAESWNHSKIIATDGTTALVGGLNMWTKDYLLKDPIHDVWVRVKGGAAADAQRFANRIWKVVCAGQGLMHHVETFGVTGCLPEFTAPASTATDGAAVISVGRLGAIDAAQPGDAALVAMINSAKTSLRISQQDLGSARTKLLHLPVLPWPTERLHAIGSAIARGVDVQIVLSQAGKEHTDYGNGWSLAEVTDKIKDAVRADWPAGIDLDAQFCSKLRIAFANASDVVGGAWKSGEPYGLHAKVVVVDSAAFYVGSQNLYTANLQEFGYIIDDAASTRAFLASFKLWDYSKPAAGADSAACER